MLSGKQVTIDYIIEQLDHEYGFTGLTYSDVSEYVWKVIGYLGTPEALIDEKPAIIEILDYRGILPYNLHTIIAIREYSTGTIMAETTDLFHRSSNENLVDDTEVTTDVDPNTGEEYYTVVFSDNNQELYRYKTQGDYIYTAFEEGMVEMSYKAFPVDNQTGLPMLPDDAIYLKAVISFIAERIAMKMMLQDLLSERKYEILRQMYLFNAGAAKTHCIMPDNSRMQVLVNRWKSPHPYYEHMATGFKYSGTRN